MTTQAFTRLIDALNTVGATVRNAGTDRITATCPAHDDSSPSLSVTDTETRTLVHCHAGCATDDVLAALDLGTRDLYDSDRVDYCYPDGRVKRRNTIRKEFTQPGNNAGHSLYRSDRLADTELIYVCEGEEDVHAAESLGAVATCTPSTSGAEKFDFSPLHGKRVVVVQDRDTAGRKHGALLVSLLTEHCDVRLTESKCGKDLSDHVAAGGTLDDLVPVRSRPRELRITKGSAVITRRVDWIVRDWIPAGSLTLLAGREGLGKSTIAASICAQVTTGTTDGMLSGVPRTVLYVHTEDAREFTVAPRLRAAGADMERVLFVDVQTETTDDGTLILPLDTLALEKVIAEHNVAMVVLDAATSSMSSELSGKDDRAVRQFLEPLSQLAGRRDCVVLGICHFGKRDGADTGKLILGSIAWSQVARSVLSIAQDDETGHLIVTNTKGNLAPRVRSMEASIESTTIAAVDGDAEIGVLRWHGESTRDARDLLGGPDDDADADDRTEAEAWLADYLTEHGRPEARAVKDAARKARISEPTVKRAAKKLGVVYTYEGFPRISMWSLPGTGFQSAHATPAAVSHEPTEPAEPTGLDLGKPDEPTGAKTQLAHTPVNEPTAPADRSNVISIAQRSPSPTSRSCAICLRPLPESSRGRVHVECALAKAKQRSGGDAS